MKRQTSLSYPGNTKGGSITVPLTSCLTGLESAVWQLTIFAFICKTDQSKPGKLPLPPLVFPVLSFQLRLRHHSDHRGPVNRDVRGQTGLRALPLGNSRPDPSVSRRCQAPCGCLHRCQGPARRYCIIFLVVGRLAKFLALPNAFVEKYFYLIFSLKRIHRTHFCQFFMAGFARQGVLDKDHTVWLNGARPSNNCIPPYLLGNALVQLIGIPTPKNTFASIKNC